MSWQEELRKLDEELAAGQISADDYRVRRDQVLSSAVSSGTDSQQGSSEATQLTPAPPAQPAQPMQPTPPPGQGDNAGDQGDAEKTQIVPGQGDAERTQAVGGWQTARPGGDADRTQVVPGVPPQAYAGDQPPRPAPGQGPYTPAPGFPPPQGWQQQPEDELSPPWAGSTFPPLAPSGSPDWVRQGPEVFEEGSSSAGKRTLLILLVVLVLGGLGTGLYFLVLNKDDSGANPPPPAQTTSQTKTTPKTTSSTRSRPTDPYVALLEDMPRPPASQQQEAKVLTLAQLAELKLLDPPEIELLNKAGVEKVPWKSAVRKAPDEYKTPDALSAMVIPLNSQAAAEQLLKDLRAYQESAGFIFVAEPLPNMPPQVVFEKAFPSGQSIYRGLYVSGKNLIRVTTIQAPLIDEAALSGSYRNHTEAMLRVFEAK